MPPYLCDVNVVLAVVDAAHQHHPAAKRWIDSLTEPGTAGLCRTTQLSLLRLLNNPAVMGSGVCNTDQAWQLFDTMLSDDRFAYHLEPANLEPALRRFTSGRAYSPKIWQDAYLAAFAQAAVLTLVSFDNGFQQYPMNSIILTD